MQRPKNNQFDVDRPANTIEMEIPLPCYGPSLPQDGYIHRNLSG